MQSRVLSPSLRRGASVTRTLLVTLSIFLSTSALAQVPSPLWTDGRGHTGMSEDDVFRMNSFSKLARQVSSAVVNIDTGSGGKKTKGSAREGSGFIVHADGYIVTNYHVIEGAKRIRVTLDDERDFIAKVVGVDPPTDLALLKIDATRLSVVPLGDSDQVEVADWVMAIGSPLGLKHSVTVGVISALDRENPQLYENFIQTDASINPGNSGGPLFNIHGEVIGINTAINPNGQGIGFAIPINVAKVMLPQLAAGEVRRSWLGVMVEPLDHKVADRLGVDRKLGALVTSVVDEGPAAQAGILDGDVIVSFDGTPVDHQKLRWLASTAGIGSRVLVELIRDGKRREVTLTLREYEDARGARAGKRKRSSNGTGDDDSPVAGEPTSDSPMSDDVGLGIRVQALDEAVRKELGADEGVVVRELAEDSPARKAGLREGDVIVHVEEGAVASSGVLRKALTAYEAGDVVRLKVRRGPAESYLAFVVP